MALEEFDASFLGPIIFSFWGSLLLCHWLNLITSHIECSCQYLWFHLSKSSKDFDRNDLIVSVFAACQIFCWWTHYTRGSMSFPEFITIIYRNIDHEFHSIITALNLLPDPLSPIILLPILHTNHLNQPLHRRLHSYISQLTILLLRDLHNHTCLYVIIMNLVKFVAFAIIQ